jgi:prepilin-type N-terminal cleavage/methylation domain-containing protein
VKHKNKGFTLVEVMTAVAIIAILVALLMPALNMVRRMANETSQKAQFAAIDMAVMAFRNDFGDYPPLSSDCPSLSNNYCGAQKLAEALLGWDLLGFSPYSKWKADGRDCSGILIYDSNNLDARRGPYLETSKANAFRLADLFANQLNLAAAPSPFVMCDVFAAKQVAIGGKTVKAGTPILYYRANTASKSFALPDIPQDRIYNAYDNQELVLLGKMMEPATSHPLVNIANLYNFDSAGGVRDPKITTVPWPYRPDSYILISAGADGLYGTSDDIHNF